MTRRPTTLAGVPGSHLDPWAPRKHEPQTLGPCVWFALCENEATMLVDHPILGSVPSCERCQRVTS